MRLSVRLRIALLALSILGSYLLHLLLSLFLPRDWERARLSHLLGRRLRIPLSDSSMVFGSLLKDFGWGVRH